MVLNFQLELLSFLLHLLSELPCKIHSPSHHLHLCITNCQQIRMVEVSVYAAASKVSHDSCELKRNLSELEVFNTFLFRRQKVKYFLRFETFLHLLECYWERI